MLRDFHIPPNSCLWTLGMLAAVTAIACHAPVVEAFQATSITFAPQVIAVPCAPNVATVHVQVEGRFTRGAVANSFFVVRLVDGDWVFDDHLVELKIKKNTGDTWTLGEDDIRTFDLVFTLQCADRGSCSDVVGVSGTAAWVLAEGQDDIPEPTVTVLHTENSGESSAELALEIDAGNVRQWGNLYDSTLNDYVPATCNMPTAAAPTSTGWEMIALGALLVAAVAYVLLQQGRPGTLV
jgi:hypothetical protein